MEVTHLKHNYFYEYKHYQEKRLHIKDPDRQIFP